MPWAFRPTWANMAPFFIPTEDPQWPPWLREAMDQPDAAVAPATAKGYFRWTSRETGLRMHGRHIWATSEDYAGSNNKRHVFFLHGLAEHSNKHYYTALCARLAARGYNCHLMDMQGHGYSAAVSPRRVKSAQSLIEDARQFVEDTLSGALVDSSGSGSGNGSATTGDDSGSGGATIGDGATFALVSFSTGGAIGIALTESLHGTALERRCVGHYAMAPLVTNPFPASVRALSSCLCCCPGAQLLPYMTARRPWISFVHPDVYEVEVLKDQLNWKRWHAVGNVPALATLTRHATHLAALVTLPIRVAKGDYDAVLDGSAHALIQQSPYAQSARAEGDNVVRMFPGQPHCIIQGLEGENLVEDIEVALDKWFAAAPPYGVSAGSTGSSSIGSGGGGGGGAISITAAEEAQV